MIVNIDGRTIKVPGPLIVLALATAGDQWAIDEIQKPDFEGKFSNACKIIRDQRQNDKYSSTGSQDLG
jgi:hypothetical protein